jgi:hypothetical protein
VVGEVAESSGTQTAMLFPAISAGIVVLAAVVNLVLSRRG